MNHDKASPAAKIASPPQSPQPVARDLYQALDGDAGRYALVAGHCSGCGRHFYPLPGRCSSCHGPLTRALFGERGSIYSFTVVRTRAPFGLPEPYAVGYVDAEDLGLRVFGLLDPGCIDRLSVGAPVRLDVLPLGGDAEGRPCLRPVFTLCRQSGKGGEQ